QGGDVMAEWGPMSLIVSAFAGKVPQPDMSENAGRYAFTVLEKISRLRKALSRPWKQVPDTLREPAAFRMLQSVMAVGDPDLTPMAAVAGAIADAVADYLAGRGMTKVIVNNGGDIAIRLMGEESATVGIREDIRDHDFSRVIRLGSERTSWGVATSGLGGRSLTRGIASAATVIARTASAADAAATAVANASFVKDMEVVQADAESLAQDTDIPGIPVTCQVGPLREETRSLAVEQALSRARSLMENGAILGAFVSVAGLSNMTDSFRKRLIHR
ncbi:MAG: FAD:protein FMN transferase, partial [Deltaproteobacteria bacterium]|nr:FAD:protein FMN transferase [Deltaproteobacteria bacterium]